MWLKTQSSLQHQDYFTVAEYAIGDLQGCYDALQQLLTQLDFNEHTDRLWFVGDLVNRGPQSLAVLRFIKQLPLTPRITLGNHDLHLLANLFCESRRENPDDTLKEIYRAPDAHELGHWLRAQSLLHHDEALNVVMCHAGIAPMWTLTEAKARANELEAALSGPDYLTFLNHMYGNKPDHWSPNLTGIDRLRVICNYFTRMRLCNEHGHLISTYKGDLAHVPANSYPWYAVPHRKDIQPDIVFGHWAALNGQCPNARIHAIDTGYLWGRSLTAMRLDDKQRFEVSNRSRSKT
jgi:bis(5'-nucleosyl)-tetraphosphatase (symmetrical)